MEFSVCSHGDAERYMYAVCEMCGKDEWGCTEGLGYRHLCDVCFVVMADLEHAGSGP